MDHQEVVRTGPICWAQHWLWFLSTPIIRGEDGTDPTLYIGVRVPENCSIDLVRQALEYVSDRHESLRTIYPWQESGEPLQVVLKSATPNILTYDQKTMEGIPNTHDLARYLPQYIDVTQQTSFAAVAIIEESLVSRLIIAAHPIAVDGASLGILRNEIEAIIDALRHNHRPTLDSAAWHPIDQACSEADGELRAFGVRAFNYWNKKLQYGPHSTAPYWWEPPEQRSLLTVAVSAKLGRQCTAAAQKYRVSIPALLQSALAILLTCWTESTSCCFGSATSNRWSRHLKESVGRYAGGARILTDVPQEARFSDFARHLAGVLMSAYTHSRFDIGADVMAGARLSSRIGARVSEAVSFEFYDYLTSIDTSINFAYETDPFISQVELAGFVPNVLVGAISGEAGVQIMLQASRCLLNEEAAREFLRAFTLILERISIEADPTVSEITSGIQIPGPWSGVGWSRVRHAWVNLHEIEAAIRKHDSVKEAKVFPIREKTPEGAESVMAFVSSNDPSLTVSELDDHVRDVLSHCPATLIPNSYVICKTAPDEIDDASPWAAQEVLASGERDTARFRPPHGDAEETLSRVFLVMYPNSASTNSDSINMAQTYSELGGTFLQIPKLIDLLENAGYSGAWFDDFIGLTPMWRIAKKLRPPTPTNTRPA